MPLYETLPKEEQAEKFLLAKFLSHKNPKAKKYQEIIEAEARRATRVKEITRLDPPTDEYSEQWLQKVFLYKKERLIKFFRERLSGDILIDLGGGRQPSIKMLAKNFKVRTYIDVEKYISEKLTLDSQANITESLKWNSREDDTEIVLVQADMLDFISRIPDNSANFTINGVDTLVILSPQYHSALASEISRTTKIGGIVFGMNSDALWEVDKERFRNVTEELEEHRPDIKIFEKIK